METFVIIKILTEKAMWLSQGGLNLMRYLALGKWIFLGICLFRVGIALPIRGGIYLLACYLSVIIFNLFFALVHHPYFYETYRLFVFLQFSLFFVMTFS